MSRRAASAIVGLGMTEMTRKFTASAPTLAVEAIRRALDDAGLGKGDVDGLLINRSPVAIGEAIGLRLQIDAGLRDLRLLNVLEGEGSSAGQIVQLATLAVEARMADAVVCVFADTPLVEDRSAGAAFAQAMPLTGLSGFEEAYGLFGAPSAYALAARRHMHLYGTSEAHFGAIAVSNRKWAEMNPLAVMRKPVTLEDHRNSRPIVDPFRLLDCAPPCNGAIAVAVTSAERARDLRQPPVHVLGMGQAHPGNPRRAPREDEVDTGARLARDTAFGMAGVTTDDIEACEFYDPFTYVTLVTLEDYGFCEKGEGGPFIAEGNIEPGGELPTNTGGGQLSGYYMQGMTSISEAVIQARGHAGERQIPNNDAILATGNGGRMDLHSCLVLSPSESAG
ncbi:MAG: thiolase family protein [Rubrobacteraceae bacterium]